MSFKGRYTAIKVADFDQLPTAISSFGMESFTNIIFKVYAFSYLKGYVTSISVTPKSILLIIQLGVASPT